MKYTQGKWTNEKATLNVKDPMFYKSDVICGGLRIAQVAGIGEDNSNANAQLIAAAPELLDVLKHFVRSLASGQREKCDIALVEAKQAIAKAEGE